MNDIVNIISNEVVEKVTIICNDSNETIEVKVVENIESIKVVTSEVGLPGETGDTGLSAYQIAVNNGFVGTEIEWLASLPASTIDILLNYNIAKL